MALHLRDALLADLLAIHFGLAARADLRTIGYSNSAISRLVERGLAEYLLPGVLRFRSAPRRWEQKPMAAWLWAGKDAALISGLTAATLHGLGSFRNAPIELVTERRMSSRNGIIVHVVKNLQACDRCFVQNIAVTTATRTIIDCAPYLPDGGADVMVDKAARDGKTTYSYLRGRLEELGPAARSARRILAPILDERGHDLAIPESALESLFVALIRGANLPQPARQLSAHRGTSRIGRLDFVYADRKINIEVDGRKHHVIRRDFQRDRERDNDLNLMGWIVLRFTWHDVLFRPNYVVDKIREALGIRPLFH